MTKNKNKNQCTLCKTRHEAPTGKKCKYGIKQTDQSTPHSSASKSWLSSTSASSSDSELQDLQLSQLKRKCQKKSKQLKSKQGKKQSTQSTAVTESEEEDKAATVDPTPEAVQQLILQQLQRVNPRLDSVEERMSQVDQGAKKKDITKLSRTSLELCNKKSKSKKVPHVMSSESSSDESDLPSLSVLKSSRQVQRKVDERLAEIQNESRVEGNNTTKIKSKRGGSVDMVVCKRVLKEV